MREDATLRCDAHACTITAAQPVGALRALETLAQLAHSGNVPVPFSVEDSPRFPYRALLIDSARRFLPLRQIERLLDAMSTTKLNVLHWHLTDDTAFPVQSESYPQLAEKGAYHPFATYSRQNLSHVVEYAATRGVRVVPEFDMPGHSSYGRGMPQLTIAACGGALDPTLDATYHFLRTFLLEMTSIFPDQYLALGGDEVSYTCAAAVKKQWLQAHNMSAAALLPYFWRRVGAEVLPSLHRTLHVWGTNDLSNLDPHIVPAGSVFNLYTDLSSTLNTTAVRGVPGILSAPYYLDQTQSYRMGPGLEATPTRGCGASIHHINEVWRCFYSAGPADGVDSELATNTSLVLGGEVCIWGEGTSAFSIEVQTLTLAAAVAERLWTGRADDGASSRLEAYVCMLNTMGLNAAPISPGFCLADTIGPHTGAGTI